MSSGIFHLGHVWRMHAGVAFNALSTWDEAGSQSGSFCADHPMETLAFCRTLTPFMLFRHDCLPHDFTVFLYRE